ncbi:hypothetical protein BT96DRAFT_843138, partial [Gymnopus androsaceus JB14]
APIYAFFDAEPTFEFDSEGTIEYLVWRCSHCGEVKRQGMKTKDKGSTGALSAHAKKCWGEEAVAAVRDSNLEKARSAIKNFGKKSQTRLTAALKTFKGWADMFSTQPPEKETTRVVTARWVAESARPFCIVRDRCYRWLQKEGRPKQYVPSKETVARDVKKLYTKTKEKLAEELQAVDGELPVVIDCWTLPNHL